MHDKLHRIIKSVSPISAASLHKISDRISYQQIKKGETICCVGQRNNSEYFLLEGICKSYLLTPDGENVTLSFFMSKAVLSPHTTRSSDGKAIINISALTDAEIAIIDATVFENLMIDDLEIRAFGNAVLRNELMEKVQKEIALASLKGIDRLHRLRKIYPNIENQIPHADIASYLGMTTISLSRLRTQT